MKVSEWRGICQTLPGTNCKTFLTVTVLFILFPLLNGYFNHDQQYEDMPHNEVERWAQFLGNHAYEVLNEVSRYKKIEENFKSQGADITKNDGLKLVQQMAEDINNMMKYKVQAVKRIMNVAEEVSQDASFLDEEWRGYYNAKVINRPDESIESLKERYQDQYTNYYGKNVQNYYKLKLNPNTHFDNIPVNLNMSTVHVPTNVFEGSCKVKKAIRWSEALEKTFYSNYEHDPTLSWQYFGSSTGFLRQFPGAAWSMDAEDPDMYDARLRPWYIQAANSAKDMIILLDVSGSMTGLRKEIAKLVVMNILDTLTENDFFNVFKFHKKVDPVIKCLENTTVQANLENVGAFKRSLNITTKNIANFTAALETAFNLLQKRNSEGFGSQCNQAIMLVTDGAPETYESIFEAKNWPQKQIRLFTYLIGREVTEKTSLKWMACNNKGYFVHVTTPSEVREQVLKYIPVIARPMVMCQEEHPIIWTGVYADIATPVLPLQVISIPPKNPVLLAGRRLHRRNEHGYTLMTTVSVPVFNRTQKVKTVADLLGVAGTDVPIKEIKKLTPAYKLGVNGYSFMVNKNGFVVFHPDLRPTFQEILKPNYNSVDLTEVELPDSLDEPRENDTELYTLRREMIEQRSHVTNFTVRTHMDVMHRVVIRNQNYFAVVVNDTPFSLGIALPEDYGEYKIHGEIELHLAMKEDPNINASSFFQHGSWSLHPDWVYCEYKYDQGIDRTPEELLKHFLAKAQMPRWKWRSTRTRPPPDSSQTSGSHHNHDDDNDYYCDKTLIQSLLFDAKATNVYGSNNRQYEKLNVVDVGVTSAFLATRSGLTRWINLKTPEGDSNEPSFMDCHNKAIDEVWYRRAVDYYKTDPEAYVYSVPFDAATRDPKEVHVTASRAIFIKRNRFRSAPAAVVGVNIQLDRFSSFFQKQTYNCRDSTRPCNKNRTCQSGELDCYLLDDNGYVVASEDIKKTGQFFGAIEGAIMRSLIQSEVYREIKIFDYQSVCFKRAENGNFGTMLLTPFQTLKWIYRWIVGNIMWFLIKIEFYQLWDPDLSWAYVNGVAAESPSYNGDYENNIPPNDDTYSNPPDATEAQDFRENDAMYSGGSIVNRKKAYIKRTLPHPCDKKMILYQLNSSKLKEAGRFKPVKGKLSNCHQNGCTKPFCIQKVMRTNLVLLVVHNKCNCERQEINIDASELEYNETEECKRQQYNNFRKRPKECFHYHPSEENITDCGGCSEISILSLRTLITIAVAHIVYVRIYNT